MTKLTLEKVLRLHGIKTLQTTPSQEKFLIESTHSLIDRHGEKYFQDPRNQKRLLAELEVVLKEI
jgi:endonuclease III-like uncharacterized protein